MTNRLSGKTCFVTGAAQGIGCAIAESFATEGARVIAADLSFNDDREEHERITQVVLDVTSEEAVAEMARAHRDVGVLVNCVGMVAHGNVLDSTLADFDRSYAVNVRSMALTIKAFLPAMLERQAGSIINIASVVSSVVAAPDRFAYGTSKGAVIALTKSVAKDFITRGIRCNSISPGTIESPSLHQRFAATGDVETARQAFIARQPMGRLGQPEEIASIAMLLASDEACFMSGNNIVIDGGWSL